MFRRCKVLFCSIQIHSKVERPTVPYLTVYVVTCTVTHCEALYCMSTVYFILKTLACIQDLKTLQYSRRK